jgi:hypothetical protein
MTIIEAAKGEIALSFTTLLHQLGADGTDDDILALGTELGSDMATAIATQDLEAVEEIKAQFRGLAEIKRVRVNDAASEFMDRAIDMAARVGMALLKAAIPGA